MSDIRRSCQRCRKPFYVDDGDGRRLCMDCMLSANNRRTGVQQADSDPDERPEVPEGVRQHVCLDVDSHVRVYDYDPKYRGRRRKP